eukprot:328342-Ditylum_brightwellii.AAC.1
MLRFTMPWRMQQVGHSKPLLSCYTRGARTGGAQWSPLDTSLLAQTSGRQNSMPEKNYLPSCLEGSYTLPT